MVRTRVVGRGSARVVWFVPPREPKMNRAPDPMPQDVEISSCIEPRGSVDAEVGAAGECRKMSSDGIEAARKQTARMASDRSPNRRPSAFRRRFGSSGSVPGRQGEAFWRAPLGDDGLRLRPGWRFKPFGGLRESRRRARLFHGAPDDRRRTARSPLRPPAGPTVARRRQAQLATPLRSRSDVRP